MNKKVLLTGTCILVLAVLAGVLALHPNRYGLAPEVTFKIIDGRQINMKDLRGRPVLVTFWATTCSTCLGEMPHLISLYNELSGKGFEIIGVAMAYDPPNRVLELARVRSVPYAIALDIDSSVAHAFDGVTLTPTSVLIAPDGRIITHNVGALNMQELRAQIMDMLKQSQVPSLMLQEADNRT